MRFVAVLASVLILGCGGTESVVAPPIPSPTPTPPQFPNVLGAWTGSDTLTILSDIGNSELICEMTWDVTVQRENGVFGGMYSRRPGDCDRTGAFAARIQLDGSAEVTFGGSGTSENCQVIRGDGSILRGFFRNGRLTARTSAVLQCPTRVGQVQAELTHVVDMVKR